MAANTTPVSLSGNSADLLTVVEAMGVLRIGRTKFYELVNAGTLPVIRLGRRTTRVRREALEQLAAHGVA